MKLFKKAMAAVLAGVLALSMVACAPANGGKEETKVPESSATTAEGKFFDMLNGYVSAQQTVANATNVNIKYVYPKFSNELKADAEAVLEAIANAEATSVGGKLTTLTLKGDALTALATKMDGKLVYKAVKSENTMALTSNIVFAKLDKSKDEGNGLYGLVFNDQDAADFITSNFGYGDGYLFQESADSVSSTTDGVTTTTMTFKAGLQFGIASKDINGVTCTVMVLKKVA